jgi:hypothetical protein
MVDNQKHIYEMEQTEIEDFIDKLLPVKKHEKERYGEVFTHPTLIHKMLDLFPSDVWTNHTLTWLDPSVGVGFFMIYVYLRLMNGLKAWEPNDTKRSKHIIENMLFMVELNNHNCRVCTNIFGIHANLVCADFLSDFTFKQNHPTLFDCIVGNPPFQDYYGANKTGRRINGGKSKLYERIFLKSLLLLNLGGFLSFIVPDNLFGGCGSQSYQKMMQKHIHIPFVSFNPQNQSFFYKIQQPICYFILHNRLPDDLTKREQEATTTIEYDNHLQFQTVLQNRRVNPIRNWTPCTESLICQFVSHERNNACYVRGKSLPSYNGTLYSVIYTLSKYLYTNDPKLSPGLGIKKAVIFSVSPKLDFKMDYLGIYGSGPNTFYIPFSNEKQGKKLETFLNSQEYKILALATKTTRQYLKIALIEYLTLAQIME